MLACWMRSACAVELEELRALEGDQKGSRSRCERAHHTTYPIPMTSCTMPKTGLQIYGLDHADKIIEWGLSKFQILL